ncbi:hypothetical protein BT93_A1465 [Corymbia citriodora subsp. variegata]|nr:hypothetical protein BT93_A1465 [Corymbia citriodora subsp. variegata]
MHGFMEGQVSSGGAQRLSLCSCYDAEWSIRDLGHEEYGMKESWIKDYSIGCYLLEGLQNHVPKDYNQPWCNISKILMRKRFELYVRVLGMLRNGEILLEYRNRALVCYDPNRDKAVHIMLEGLPMWFESVVRVASISRM